MKKGREKVSRSWTESTEKQELENQREIL